MKKILLTGGLGYIGSHVAVELAAKDFEIVILDDLSNSELFVLDRLKELTGKHITFEHGTSVTMILLVAFYPNMILKVSFTLPQRRR